MPLFGRSKKQLPVTTPPVEPQRPFINPVVSSAATTGLMRGGAPSVGNVADTYKGTETFDEVFPVLDNQWRGERRLDEKIGSPLDTRGPADDGVYYAEPRAGKGSPGGHAVVAALAASRGGNARGGASTQGIGTERASDFDTGFVPRGSGPGRTHIPYKDPRDFGDDYLQL